MLVDQIVNGVSLGAIYALFAVGFGIVFSTMKILNLAQGVYATWGALFMYWVVTEIGLGYWPAVVLGALGAAAVAILVDQVAFQPLRARGGAALLGAIITSVALWLALRETASILTGAAPLGLPSGAAPSWRVEVFGVPLMAMQVISVVGAIVVTTAIYFLLQRSRVGSAIRAVGYDRVSAVIGGVNPRRAIIIGAGLAGMASGLAGIFLASNQTFTFAFGDQLLLTGFAAVVIGGAGDVRGSAFGGFIVGVIEVLSAEYISSSLRNAIVFGLLMVFMLTRPRGLFGNTELVRA